jgi:arylsulfatase
LFVAFACNASLHATSALAQAPDDRATLPMPLSKFEGKIGKTYEESESAWQHPPVAP